MVRYDYPTPKGDSFVQVILSTKKGANHQSLNDLNSLNYEGAGLYYSDIYGTHIKKCSVQKLHGTTFLEI